MSNNNNEFGAFISGFFRGGIIGAAVALILAPQSGEETRTIIREKGIELKDKAAGTAEETKTRVEKTAADARLKAEELAKQAKDKSSDLMQKGQVVLEDQKGKIGEAIESGKKAVARKPKEEDAADEGEAEAAS